MRILEIIQKYGLDAYAPGLDLESIEIHSVASIEKAGPGQLGFFTAMEYAPLLSRSKASALIVREPVSTFAGVQLVHKDPQFIFAKLALEFHKVDHGPLGVHPEAYVDPLAKVDEDVRIHRGAYIDAGCEIARGVVIYPGVVMGKNCKIGQGTVLHPNVVIYSGTVIGHSCLIHAGCVIGADGFGFTVSESEICKIPQSGVVRIGNHVELGALCTVDRAASDETVIEDHCKFDDHVHIAHNCTIGRNTMFSAQVGIAGSTTIGEWTLIGGQSGVADHLKLPPKVRVGSKSGVITQLKEPGTYAGFPAIPVNEWKRNLVYVRRIKAMDDTIKALEKRLAALEAKN
jgi:UDP-3-O-[3-hydroxymyristoyl] glucosamine N-acyltransferase